ncbi:hypothetical protein SLEP1_g41970 [Rubroshorea leprosula]|uniref:PH domain-containing protein n=1 Tax=Rubroshorea leprosula TaxID=152421 RepID=A0AAV5L8P2_9ROSI|nr:hypothetical protein SLEP1_g41970 [Rubroshorea leprosula]
MGNSTYFSSLEEANKSSRNWLQAIEQLHLLRVQVKEELEETILLDGCMQMEKTHACLPSQVCFGFVLQKSSKGSPLPAAGMPGHLFATRCAKSTTLWLQLSIILLLITSHHLNHVISHYRG